MNSRQPVAIVGIGGIFPGAKTLPAFWDNIARGVDCSREAPLGRWVLDADQAFDSRKAMPDKVYSRRACFVEEFELLLDGLQIDAKFVDDLDPMVRLALHAGAAAMSTVVKDFRRSDERIMAFGCSWTRFFGTPAGLSGR
jgi:acyl transferase domain-containing protein